MLDPREELLLGLAEAQSMSSATFSYLSGSTPLTCSVYQSFGFNVKYETDTFEYQKIYEDQSVIAKVSDVGTWGLEPKKSKVHVNGFPYMIGGVVTYTDIYYWISLRRYTSIATSQTP